MNSLAISRALRSLLFVMPEEARARLQILSVGVRYEKMKFVPSGAETPIRVSVPPAMLAAAHWYRMMAPNVATLGIQWANVRKKSVEIESVELSPTSQKKERCVSIRRPVRTATRQIVEQRSIAVTTLVRAKARSRRSPRVPSVHRALISLLRYHNCRPLLEVSFKMLPPFRHIRVTVQRADFFIAAIVR